MLLTIIPAGIATVMIAISNQFNKFNTIIAKTSLSFILYLLFYGFVKRLCKKGTPKTDKRANTEAFAPFAQNVSRETFIMRS